jgi:hypothetical protein
LREFANSIVLGITSPNAFSQTEMEQIIEAFYNDQRPGMTYQHFGYIQIGTSHETSEFACEAIRRKVLQSHQLSQPDSEL